MATYTFEHYERPPTPAAFARLLEQAVIVARDDTAAIRLARDRAISLSPKTDMALLLDENAAEIWIWRDPLS